jgi:ketosteroid isomerase-like protein
MKKHYLLPAIIICLSFSAAVLAQQSGLTPEQEEIRQQLEAYKLSINRADTALASSFWAKSDDVSFIHPRGHEKGWQQVRDNFYGRFASVFTTRDLKSHREVFNVYGDLAVVEFYWIFDAIFKADDKPMQSKGRETQIWRRQGGAWRLFHIHYSGLPASGEREGF